MKARISVVGAGKVGTTIAYTLMLKNLATEIMLTDCNSEKCNAEVSDLQDALVLSETSSIISASYKEAACADIIILSAGKAQQPGESRAHLLDANVQIIATILNDMGPISQDSILIVVTNPVDTLTSLTAHLSNLPKQQVIGSGTLLDSLRWRGLISQQVGIAPQSVQANIIGNHGDLQVPLISSVSFGGSKTQEISHAELERLAVEAQNKVYGLLEGKGYTQYGVACAVSILVENILYNKKEIIPVVSYNDAYDAYLSNLVTLGSKGVSEYLPITLSATEKEQLENSIKELQERYKSSISKLKH